MTTQREPIVAAGESTKPDLRPGESWERGAMFAAELIAEVVERADYSHVGTMAGRLPLREWLEARGNRWDWPMIFRDGFTCAPRYGPALVSSGIEGSVCSGPQYSGVFPLYREGPAVAPEIMEQEASEGPTHFTDAEPSGGQS